ncbi:MAG: WYL domain-containing protein [Duncaniella sp.]|nr:WYL domain-containing protein [Duncaniella sp.]MDE5735086.1 WYL domain-containing protein [Duncaniella sp.]MDE6390145.1 WYL domain-containing protein [Duncaniella sp.]
MSHNLLGRYVWIIDTIRRYGSITLRKLNELWQKSAVSDGQPLPRRTFYNYRLAIAELFNITIASNPSTYEYYIDAEESRESITDWLLNSAAMSNVLSTVSDVSDLIFLEDIPSARLYLSQVVSALRDRHPVRFTYRPYTRSTATPGVVVEPYFLKIFRQRWYMTGRNTADGRIKTYALDRMEEVRVDEAVFTPDPAFDAGAYVRDAFGIIFSQGETKEVVIKTSPRQAKYLRALPLHHSQSEGIHDDYSLFHYRLRLTEDFVQELLSLGPKVTVLAPPELKAMVVTSLRDTLALYE